MIWAFLSRFQDILAFIGFLTILWWGGRAVWWAAHLGSRKKEDA